METTRYFVKNDHQSSARFQLLRHTTNPAEAAKLSADDRFSEIQLSETEKARLKLIHGDLCLSDILDKYAKN